VLEEQKEIEMVTSFAHMDEKKEWVEQTVRWHVMNQRQKGEEIPVPFQHRTLGD
jgi:hypothetical protein